MFGFSALSQLAISDIPAIVAPAPSPAPTPAPAVPAPSIQQPLSQPVPAPGPGNLWGRKRRIYSDADYGDADYRYIHWSRHGLPIFPEKVLAIKPVRVEIVKEKVRLTAYQRRVSDLYVALGDLALAEEEALLG